MMSSDCHVILVCDRVWEDHRGGPTGSRVRAMGVQRGRVWGGAGMMCFIMLCDLLVFHNCLILILVCVLCVCVLCVDASPNRQ